MSMFYELMMRKKEEIMYATIKGTLTENDGVFSGFSANNYLALQEPFAPTGSWEIVTKITTGNSLISNVKYFLGNFNSERSLVVGTTDKPIITFKAFISTNGGVSFNIQLISTVEAQTNTEYYIRVGFTGTTYYLDFSTDGINYVGRAEYSSTSTISPYILYYGRAFGVNNIWNGSIDLNNSYIKLGSTKYNLQAVVGYTVVGSPTITDGVVSGFSFTSYNSGNYLQINNGQINFSTDDFKIKLCASKINTVSTQETLIATTNIYPMGIYVFSNRVELRLYTSNNTLIQKPIEYNIPSNTKFYISLEKKGNNFIFGVSLDNINFTYNNFVQADIQMGNQTISIGHDYYRACPNCAIYLNETTIYKNNKLWFNGQQA